MTELADQRVATWRPRVSELDFDSFATTLFFLVVAFTACLMPAQSDTWWQLRAGQDIVERGLQLRETFSHTQEGGYWPNHEWLSQFVFYGLYQLGGLPRCVWCAGVTASSHSCSPRGRIFTVA